ncbi:MAG: beta-N-acetylhexosaminidase [Rhizobiales bacterium]|nr:beta-N-acetylhexosaminidase [Hyphomicrobiales bacterium]NRB13498.1 beta-N-acetylhexosaminidase [Hyphomicrobiales bacterium]
MTHLKLKINAEIFAETQMKLTVCLQNLTDEFIAFDKLCFNFIYPMADNPFDNATLLSRVATYYELAHENANSLEANGLEANGLETKGLEAGENWQFTLVAGAVLNQYSDMPSGVFAVNGDEIVEVIYTKDDKIAARTDKKATKISVAAATTSREINIFPLPNQIIMSGDYADLSRGFRLNADEIFAKSFDHGVQIERDFAGQHRLFTKSDNGIEFNILQQNTLAAEAYKLDISQTGINLSAASAAGVHNGLMSLWQMAIVDPQNVACAQITDQPRFEWRGQHLDVARQFYSVDEVKRFINHMALYKLNKFHWHLTDDEAWRVEIKALPELTNNIAQRGYGQFVAPSYGSGAASDGGFYSQQEIREIITYASARNVEVIPEIDIPGHCYALIKLLPELTEAEDLSQYRSVQGYEADCLNPALPRTYEIIDIIFAEIAELFPSDFIHIGADERAEGTWEKSPKVAELMAQNGYNSTEQVQTHFIKKVQEITAKYGKKTGAWEEASEQGEIDKDGYIVSWKGVQAGIDAAERGYNVVMSPAQYCYFDMAQSADFDEAGLTWTGTYVGLQDTYNYEPIPDGATAAVQAKFKGIQGCLWSENLHDKTILDQQLFPRLIALSEICWAPKGQKDYPSFLADLKKLHRPLLNKLALAYRQKDFS